MTLIIPPTTGRTGPLPRIHVFAAAGTLQRNPANRMNYAWYTLTGEERLTTRELVDALPEAQLYARMSVESDTFTPADTPEEMVALSLLIQERLNQPDIDGAILIHGTSNMEEIAYFLNLTVQSTKPVIITGSQRPFYTLSSDGPINLLSAIRVAADPQAHGQGAMVVMNTEINAARDVTKSSTFNLDTFQSLEFGPIGLVDADQVNFYRSVTRTHTAGSRFKLSPGVQPPRVDVLYAHPGNDGLLAEAAVKVGAKGLVIAGSGAGGTNNAKATLHRLYQEHGTIIVRSSRGGRGRVISGDNWDAEGFVTADNLNPGKARILLQLALTQTNDPAEIQRIFETY